MYAKIINGQLHKAPKKLIVDSVQVWNAPAEAYLAQGWKPVVFTDAPEAPTGYYYESGWTEEDDEIVQTWTLVPLPDDIDEYEAYQIIVGGAE